MNRPTLTESEIRRHQKIFELKAQSGALSFLEETNAQEAALFAGLLHDAVWPSPHCEARFAAAYDIRNFIRQNAMLAVFDKIARLSSAKPPLPLPAILILLLESLKLVQEEKVEKPIEELRSFLISRLDSIASSCFDPSEI